MNIDKNAPIGVFDSGMGGLSVLKELKNTLPNESFLYFGDSACAPYGEKTKDEIRERAAYIAEHLIVEQKVKALVIACNTATSAAVAELRRMYDGFIIVGMEPALKPAALSTPHPHVLILATNMTLRLEKFHDLLTGFSDKATFYLLPLPGLVRLVEEGNADTPETEEYLRAALADYIADPPDCAVLGCTHFPFALPAFRRVLGEKVEFFDGRGGTARQLKRRLEAQELLKTENSAPYVHFENSLQNDMILARMEKLYGKA